MKWVRYMLVLCFLPATMAFAASDNLHQQARDAYSNGDYVQAISIYETMTQEGESDELYYNLGNAYYKNNQIGKAILNYERALRLNPSYDDAAFNLQLANEKIQDKIEPIERFFLSQWIDSLRALLSSNTWAWISIIMFSLTLLAALGYALGLYKWIRKTSFFLMLFFLMFTITTFVFARQQKSYMEKRADAIVMEGSVTVKSSPDESGTELFIIHEGTKVFIKSGLNQWVEISLLDGNVGWVRKSQIEQI